MTGTDLCVNKPQSVPVVFEPPSTVHHWMYFLHAINSDRQTRLLNALGQIAMILGDKKIIMRHILNVCT